MEAKLIDKFVEFKGFPSECFDALDWAEYEAFEVGYMKALFEFGDFSGLKREVNNFLTNLPKEENNEHLNIKDVEKEIWKDVIGYEGLYQISNFGRVKSLGRETISKYGLKRTTKEKFLTTSLNNEGWLRVTLFKDNKRKYFVLGRLVAKHFLKNYNSCYTISYKDGDTSNCNVNNLYITHKLK